MSTVGHPFDGTSPGPASSGVGRRATWRTVAVPAEHGGWSLTAEPALLGLLVAFSGAGLALAVAAMLAFVARTPIKLVLVDRWRHRWLARTTLALRIACVEVLAIVVLAGVAVLSAERSFWVPLVVAAPLIGLELWYDMRSRSRRLIPELAGSIGIGSVAAAVALAGGESNLVAAGLWCVIGARSLAAVPYVRYQILRVHERPAVVRHSDVAQLVAVGAAAAGWVADAVPLAAVVALAALAAVNAVGARRPPPRVVVIGVQQTVFGLVVIGVTAAAVLAG
ncbi:MAG: YwiC-like family protein [Ilumatobacter sp.]|uniref:YwiC-like family protein n=1 Tax=Ilumatobacter sp. TaxID=1967498 RepID=UPI00262835A2|nr:YwiC-like family protein [Ilumatobacter sp.]MDJ0770568.1 YwiC-like family protein [Ilumatobacter sp.]